LQRGRHRGADKKPNPRHSYKHMISLNYFSGLSPRSKRRAKQGRNKTRRPKAENGQINESVV
jgi:hypothetical protein